MSFLSLQVVSLLGTLEQHDACRTDVFDSLTLALMGSDDLNLRVLAASSDDEKERNAARKVLKLLSKGRHWVLVVRLSLHRVSRCIASLVADVTLGSLAR